MNYILICLLLCLSSFAAGIVNAMAGGGTLLTFPALLMLVSPVVANATSTVALVPGTLASAWGYRKQLPACGRWPWLLIVPSLIGGVVGALLLTRTHERYFSAVAPWLILGATLLLLVQPLVQRLVRAAPADVEISPTRLGLIIAGQFLVAVYGGYFGAAAGIIMLALFAFLGLPGMHQMNALKTFLGFLLNGVSIFIFVAEGKVDLLLAGIMAVSAIFGGWWGARLALRMNQEFVRWIVVAIGLAVAACMLFVPMAGAG